MSELKQKEQVGIATENQGSSLAQINSYVTTQQNSNMHELDSVGYHHQSAQFLSQVPSDPFAAAAFENAMMYVPEVTSEQTSQQQDSPMREQNHTYHQQDEMFNDIVANTGINLYINPSSAIFTAKRNLLQNNNQRPSSTIFDGFGYKNAASECQSQIDDKLDFYDEDFEEYENDHLSDFVEDSDKYLVFDFLRLRMPQEDLDNRRYKENQCRLLMQSDNDSNSQLDIFERPVQMELENCNDANGSQCCGQNDEDKDIGLDSTMSFSICHEYATNQAPARTACRNRSVSQNHQIPNSAKKDKKAYSQFNFNDMDDEEQYDEKHRNQDEFFEEEQLLVLNRQKSLRVSFAQSDIKQSQNKRGFVCKIDSLTPSAAQMSKNNHGSNLVQFNQEMDKQIDQDKQEDGCADMKDTDSIYQNDGLYQYLNREQRIISPGLNAIKHSMQQQAQTIKIDQKMYDEPFGNNYHLLQQHGHYPTSAWNNFNQYQQYQWTLQPYAINYDAYEKPYNVQQFRVDGPVVPEQIQFNDKFKQRQFESCMKQIEIIDLTSEVKAAETPSEKSHKTTLRQKLSTPKAVEVKKQQKSEALKSKSHKIQKAQKTSKPQKNLKISQKKKEVKVSLKSSQDTEAEDCLSSKVLLSNENVKSLLFQKTDSESNTVPEGSKQLNLSEITSNKEILVKSPIMNPKKDSENPEQKAKKNARQTKIDVANSKDQKYYKQFDFFFNRSCFRIFTEFFKDKFNKFYTDRLTALKQKNFQLWQQNLKSGGLTATPMKEMNVMMRDFINLTFGPEILRQDSELTDLERQQIVHSMMQIVFSHRYNKGDKFISEALEVQNDSEDDKQDGLDIDFTIVRDVMYKYSKKAQDRFFSYPIESFIFAAFALSDEGLNFLQNKPDNKADEEKLRRLQSDLAELKNQAVSMLERNKGADNDSQSLSYQQIDICQTTQTPKIGIYLFNELQRMTTPKI